MKGENHQKKWTPELDDLLCLWVGNHKSYSYMARKLGRTPLAIKRRIERLGIANKHLMTGTVSANELSKIMGVDSSVVIRTWIKRRGLPAIRRSIAEDKGSKRSSYFIYPDEFWKWAENYRNEIEFSRMERNLLVPEPEWLNKEIQKEYRSSTPKLRKLWTKEEDTRVWHLYYERGKTQKEIAKIMDRTPTSIERRLKRLRDKTLQKER